MLTNPSRRQAKSPRTSAALVVAVALAGVAGATPQVAIAADEADAPKGAAVTVIRATRTCFDDAVELFGSLQPHEEVTVRPDREGLKFTQVNVAHCDLRPGDA
jgi:HlyD family secretion protein